MVIIEMISVIQLNCYMEMNILYPLQTLISYFEESKNLFIFIQILLNINNYIIQSD